MKNSKFRFDTYFAIFSLVCLLFIRYYENVLYYRDTQLYLDKLYRLIAIPFFYYFLSASITYLVMVFFHVRLSIRMKKFIVFINIALWLIYIMFILLSLFGSITIYYTFVSIYSFVFILWGSLFALIIPINQ